jgi:hypothetical protein
MIRVFESKTTEYCYIPLYKNAHTWGENIFQNHLDFELKKFVFKDDKKYILFLRDPLKRWMSGVMEYLQGLKTDPNVDPYLSNSCKLDQLHLTLMCSIVALDVHTARQVDYIRNFYPGLRQQKMIYFFMDEHFAENVTSFLYKSFGVQVPTDKINVAKENIFKINIEGQILKFLNENPKYKENIEAYFNLDYDFLKNCYFYRANRSNL